MGTMTQVIRERTKMGSYDVIIGTLTNVSSAGGTLKTEMQQVHACWIQPLGSTVVDKEASVNETFPLISGDIRVVTNSDTRLYQFMVIGRY